VAGEGAGGPVRSAGASSSAGTRPHPPSHRSRRLFAVRPRTRPPTSAAALHTRLSRRPLSRTVRRTGWRPSPRPWRGASPPRATRCCRHGRCAQPVESLQAPVD